MAFDEKREYLDVDSFEARLRENLELNSKSISEYDTCSGIYDVNQDMYEDPDVIIENLRTRDSKLGKVCSSK